jgi:hypothetical protein
MARPGGNPDAMSKPGMTNNPSGVTKEAATLRSISQTMWGLYYTDPAKYEEWAVKYPRIHAQIEKRAEQALEGHATAMTRVDTETVGPLKQSFTFGDLDKADDETILKLAAMEIPK